MAENEVTALSVTGRELTVFSGTVVTYCHLKFHRVQKTRTSREDSGLADDVLRRAADAKQSLFKTPRAARTENERIAVMNETTNFALSGEEVDLMRDMIRETSDEFGDDDYHVGIHIGHYVKASDLRRLLARLITG
jgi:hypothetical protein